MCVNMCVSDGEIHLYQLRIELKTNMRVHRLKKFVGYIFEVNLNSDITSGSNNKKSLTDVRSYGSFGLI